MNRAGGRYGRGPHVETPLQRFLDERGIPSARVEAKLRERLKRRAPGRRKMARIRLGRTDPRRKQMVQILWAVREVANDPQIGIHQIFDLNPDNPRNWDANDAT